MSRRLSILVFALTGLFFFFFFAWPIGETLRGAFFTAEGTFTASYVVEVFKNPIYLEGLANAFLFAVASTILSVFLALPLAFLSDRFVFPGKSLLSGLILVPMILPPFVGAIGIKQILGQEGALNALLQTLGLMSTDSSDRLAGPGPFLGSGRDECPPSLPDSLPQHRRRAGEPRSRHGGGRGKPRMHRLSKIPKDYASSDHARAFRRWNDRLHLGFYGTGRAADVRVHPRDLGADFLGHQRHRRQSLSLRARRSHARRVGDPLRNQQVGLRPRFARDDGQGDKPGRTSQRPDR